MMRRIFAVSLALFFAGALLPGAASAQKPEKDKTRDAAAHRQEVRADVLKTIERFKKTDPATDRFFKNSVDYAVFARVGKMGFIIGGGHGDGEVLEKGRVIGVASISLGTQKFSFNAEAAPAKK